MKATACAPANIAFIKYWGKLDASQRIPLNDSLSMNLSGAFTVTTVEFDPRYTHDEVVLLDGVFSQQEQARVAAALSRMRERAAMSHYARVVTRNTFPKGAGSAASASGFAALTMAGFHALSLNVSERELSVFARLGSGSACRSIPDGFVLWEKGHDSETSFARSLYPSTYWDIRDALVITDARMKKVPTSEGMESITTSPLLDARLKAIPGRMDAIRSALAARDFVRLGEVVEEDCLDMHAVMQSQVPPLNYWNEATLAIMSSVRAWRQGGLSVYFTIDAGPNVHILYQGHDEATVKARLATLSGIQSIIYNTVAAGTRIVDEPLF